MYALLIPLGVLLAGSALADSYQVTFGWTDPTTYNVEDQPVYEARYRVAGGTDTTLAGLTTPGGSVDLTASPGDPIEVAARNCNRGLCSAWSPWATAGAPYPVTQPDDPSGLSITVIRTGG